MVIYKFLIDMKKNISLFLLSLPALALAQDYSSGEGSPDDALVIYGKAEDLTGVALSATQGQASREELSQRPVLRRGELLEVVPGVIITQHAGGGKANQYYVRGYNLDHGTDFHVGLDGMPANYRTHAHGQGYADLNFIVPEFVEKLTYFKGPFFASYGDLSTAGGADYSLVSSLEEGIGSVTYGAYDYLRLLGADSWEAGGGTLTLGGEYTNENGPWQTPNDYHRYNGMAKWHYGDDENFFSLTGLFHKGEWNSSDQIPLRAVQNGSLDRFGAIDDTTGGETERYTLYSIMKRNEDDWSMKVESWLGYYALNLHSNFTYFTDPVNGDQFEQDESRVFAGINIGFEREHTLFGLDAISRFGFQTKHDWIDDIGLYSTTNGRRTGVTNVDDVYQGSYGIYAENELYLTEQLRMITGLRADLFYFDVESQDNAADTNSEWDGIVSPKLGLIYDMGYDTELYFNTGMGFHSNDARGVTASVDPVDPLVRTQGVELGVRTQALDTVTASLGLFRIDSDSEFVYVGDEGTTEAGPSTTRYGVETAVYWRPQDHITLDLEYAWSFARADVPSGEFDEIDNSVPHMASAGVTIGEDYGWYGALRARYIAPRPLLGETFTAKTRPSLQVNGRVGYRWDNFDVSLDVLNILDREDRDVEYLYASQLSDESAPVEDIHFHPSEPRQVRLNFTWHW